MNKFWNKKQDYKTEQEQKKIELAESYINDKYHIEADRLTHLERVKSPYRYDIINFLLSLKNPSQTTYLEIGVRDPDHNFNKIISSIKYSVDPGAEQEINLADFPYTSDEFFNKLRSEEILEKNIKFDVIFIDGLHLADQAERDIINSLEFLTHDGFIVMHDCNPPTEFHASENYHYRLSPSKGFWNGTTWKAFFKARTDVSLYSCCIDSDWGVGVISRKYNIGTATTNNNPFYEYHILEESRKESLNLISFEDFKDIFQK